MTRRESVDVVVLGGGPAGCAAALRLTAMGRRVAVVERRDEARPQGGESLSPGIGGLLDYLGAADALDGARCVRDLPARVVWERREAEVVPPRGSVVVDRAAFDARLLEHVRESGAVMFRPARPRRREGAAGAWRVGIMCGGEEIELESPLILDARGRAGSARTRVRTGSLTVALWTHISGAILPAEMGLEATDRAWLWGAPLPGGGHRLMAFVDPAALRQGGGVADLFRGLLAESTLFGAISEFPSPVRTCPATPYLDAEAWRPGVLKIGEAALALDPLSSSGVEKSMRLALQAAVAVNTLLRDPESAELARDYYESSLISSSANHLLWTQGFYARAWPSADRSFWRERSRQVETLNDDRSGMANRLRGACEELRTAQADRMRPSVARFEIEPDAATNLSSMLDVRIQLSAAIRFIDASCVIDDLIRLHPAVIHPALDRPVAFLAGFAIVPLLDSAIVARTIRELVVGWSDGIPTTAACQIAVWLMRHGLIESASGSRSG